MKKWHKVGLGIAAVLAVVSWVIAIYYWGKLPNLIHTHFGITGQADGWSTKSIFSVFFIPFLQSLMLAGFVFLYYKPQYSDMPTTLWLMTMEQHKRDHAFELIRTMIIGVGIWIGVLFTYITFGMNSVALDNSHGLSSWILFGLIVLMLLWLVWWTVKVYRATKEAMQK